jgi:formylglycine-generating enzyme required for sulfatase activity
LESALRALIGVLAVPGLLVLLGVGYPIYVSARLLPWFWDVSTSVLTAEAERALKPGDTFMECASCPKMVVVPAGSFTMGSPANEGDFRERPQHTVTIRQPLAVSKFELTFDEWDACTAHGGCTQQFLRYPAIGRYPATNMSWAEAKQYVDWIVKLTGKPYRLLTEAEWEYVARAGTTTAYFWGDEIGEGHANCTGCGSRWDKWTAPVGSFAANAFGLHDMHGNVWEWVEDCWHDSYAGNPPVDGSAWTAGANCNIRVVRGGASGPFSLRPWWNARTRCAYRSVDAALRKPITGTACCARARTGHAAAPPSKPMNSRRFIRSPRRRAAGSPSAVRCR